MNESEVCEYVRGETEWVTLICLECMRFARYCEKRKK